MINQICRVQINKTVLAAACIAFCYIACSGMSADTPEDSDMYTAARQQMIEHDLKGRDIVNSAVLNAMAKVKRHLFVDNRLRSSAYNDHPLPIGEGQTISQPYIVALMTQSLHLKPEDKVLEIGTGSGYQAAVLAEMVSQVYSVEIIKPLADRAKELLQSLGYKNIKIKTGDGYQGWAEHAPFDAIVVTCAVEPIPPPLIKQLKEAGRIVLPLGDSSLFQTLILGTKKGDSLDIKRITSVRFVPMVGESQKKSK